MVSDLPWKQECPGSNPGSPTTFVFKYRTNSEFIACVQYVLDWVGSSNADTGSVRQ